MRGDIFNIPLKVHATDRARLMLRALEAGMGPAGKAHQLDKSHLFRFGDNCAR